MRLDDDGGGGEVLVRANNDRIILDSAPGLVSLDCMRDAKIVCKDGSARWSALLLSQWSEIVSQCLSSVGGFTSSHPLVVILPNAKIAILEKILTWSTKGSITMTQSEVSEATSVLFSLGIQTSFSQKLLPQRSAGKRVNPQVKTAIIRDLLSSNNNVKTGSNKAKHEAVNDCNKTTSREERSKGTQLDLDQSIDSAIEVSPTTDNNFDKRVSVAKGRETYCPLCPQKTTNLLRHLCLVHYCKKLLYFWGQKSPDAPCLICHQTLFDRDYGVGSGKKCPKISRISFHMGSTHGKIMEVANDEVKQIMRRHRQSLGYDTSDENWVKCLSLVKQLYPNCKVCRHHISDPQNLKIHLAQVHYREELLTHFADYDCQLCGKTIEQTHEGQSFVAIKHIMSTHVEKFNVALPRELLQSLRSCMGSFNNWQLDEALNGNKAMDMSSKRQAAPDCSVFVCPLCDATFNKGHKLKYHVAVSHFKQELLNFGEVKEMNKCPICGVTKMYGRQRRNTAEVGMAAHIATMHSGLVAVLPSAIKQCLAAMKVPIETKERLSSLEESLGRADDTLNSLDGAGSDYEGGGSTGKVEACDDESRDGYMDVTEYMDAQLQ